MRALVFRDGLLTLGALTALACGATPAPRNAVNKASPAAEEQEAGALPAGTDAATTTAPPSLRLPCAEEDAVGCTNGCDDAVIEDCVTLGAMLMTGKVIRVDQARAIDLFRGACTGGSARGCMKLGDLYHDGTLKDDPTEEAVLYRKACDAGANRGCVAAGRAYLEGRGVGADPVFAASLFARVCERGNADACLELGRLHDRGHGVRLDPSRARSLFTKACQLGHEEACVIVDGSP